MRVGARVCARAVAGAPCVTVKERPRPDTPQKKNKKKNKKKKHTHTHNNLKLRGAWRVVIQSRNAGNAQRVRVTNVEAGTQVLFGNLGNRMDVYGNGSQEWTLRIQHNDGNYQSPLCSAHLLL